MQFLARPLILVLVLAAAGCGETLRSPDNLYAPGPPVFVEPVCPKVQTPGLDTDGMPVLRSELPANFVTAWVLLCRAESGTKPGEGLVVVAERADTPATELVEQLRRPSDPPAELRSNEGFLHARCRANFERMCALDDDQRDDNARTEPHPARQLTCFKPPTNVLSHMTASSAALIRQDRGGNKSRLVYVVPLWSSESLFMVDNHHAAGIPR